VVVVEDASPDGTLAVARALQAAFGADKVVVVARPGKLGLGTAYVDGLRVARGRFVFIMDADMSHHVRACPPARPRAHAGRPCARVRARVHARPLPPSRRAAPLAARSPRPSPPLSPSSARATLTS
jgi:hypothetical protein